MTEATPSEDKGAAPPQQKQFVAFNSWKSDHPPTRSFISKALNLAAKQVMQRRPNVEVIIDDATRDLPGSPNIPVSIMDKIKAADMVVSDVTTINPEAESRRAPNPNVAFELGYAASSIGWDRIIILFNEGVAKFDDLPFDFDRQRAIKFSSVVAEGDPSDGKSRARKSLANTLADAMETIIKKDPARPTANMTPEQLKREHDRKQLLWLLTQFDIGTLDQFIEALPKMIIDIGDFMWLGVNGVMSSSAFALYDDELRQLAADFRTSFGDTLSHDNLYNNTPDWTRHVFRRENVTPERADKAWAAVSAARDRMAAALPAFLEGVRRKFPDIDLDATSRSTIEQYRKHRASIDKALD